MNLLLLVLAMPLLGFLIALAIPRSMPQASRIWAIVWSLATFVASVGLVFYFDRTVGGNQFAVDIQWIASPDIHFFIAADGVSLWLVLLSTFLTPICVLISWRSIQTAGERIFRVPAAAGIRPGGRIHRAGPVPVLRVLGTLRWCRCTS